MRNLDFEIFAWLVCGCRHGKGVFPFNRYCEWAGSFTGLGSLFGV